MSTKTDWQTKSHIHTAPLQEYTQAKAAMWTVNSRCLPAVQQNATCASVLFLQVVTGVETGRFWYGFGDASGWRPIRGQVQGGAMRSGSHRSPAGPWACYHLDLGLLHVVPNLENSWHSGLHPAGLVNACLGLKVASGLEFQAFVRASRDTGAEVEGLFKTSTKPVQEKHRLVGLSLVYMPI